MNQRVGTNGFIVKKGKFLLVKRSDNDSFLPGDWEIPGGKLEFGEQAEDGAKREILEETGLDVKIEYLLASWEYEGILNDTQYVQLDFLCTPTDDSEVKLSEEHSDFKWITFDDLDKYEMTPEMKKELLKIASHPIIKGLLA